MKILFDHQIFTRKRYGGISRYFSELHDELNNLSNLSAKISLLFSNNHYLSEKKNNSFINIFPDLNIPGKKNVFGYVNKKKTIFHLKQQNFDIFHPTYYDPYFLKYLGKKPFVLTVHDMIHEKLTPQHKIVFQKKILVEKASKIIAVSQNTKNDLIKYLRVDSSKIDVIYHGNSIFPKPNMKFNLKLPEKYLLFVGHRDGYKNFNRFIKSIADTLIDNKDLFVVCLGGGDFNTSSKLFLSDLHISNKVLHYNIDDDNLFFFYKNALAFFYPSLYEGFGIPLLESFACGCPLFCSNTSCFPEIAGKGAHYFDPNNKASMKEVVIKLLQNSDNFRESLLNHGYEQLKKFTWVNTAKETKKLYESIRL